MMNRIFRYRQAMLLSLLALALGCSRDPEERFGSEILKIIVQSHVGGFIWASVKWTILGGLTGFLFALVAFLVLRRLGAYRWEWAHAKWLRLLVLLIMIIVCSVLLGIAGYSEGLLRGSELVLRRSQLATEVFPHVADLGADLIAFVYFTTPRMVEGQRLEELEIPWEEIEEFRGGVGELEIAEIERRFGAATESVMELGIAEIKATAFERFPNWKEGKVEMIFDLVMPRITRRVLGQQLLRRAEEFGAHDFFAQLRATASAGPKATLSRNRLSQLLVQHGIVPACLSPIRGFARSTQLTVAILTLGTVLVPVGMFRTAEYIRRRPTRKGIGAG